MSAPVTPAETRVRVHLRPRGGYSFEATFPELPNAAPILLDEPPPLGESSGPNPAGVLAAAIGGCLAASLTFCLRRSHVEGSADAEVQADLVRNEQGRLRVAGVSVELALDASANDRARLDRCLALFEDYCIVTQSVRSGIPITVSISEHARS